METLTTDSDDFLSGEGEMGIRLRTMDWGHTPLGPIDQWPQSLKTSVNLMLNSKHPMWIGWGPDITFLYNDAYIPVLSLAKHPQVLGQPAAQVWEEIWDFCGPLANKVFQEGKATFVDDVRLFMNRGDYLEETYYSFSYSPIRDESGTVAGLFCPSSEVTEKNLTTRRLKTLSELATKALVEKTTQAACASAAEILTHNPDDIPFALLYLIDPENSQAYLEQVIGLPPGEPALSPAVIDLNSPPAALLWPIADVVHSAKTCVETVSPQPMIPPGVAGQAIVKSISLPLLSTGQDKLVGVLVAGINPARPLDTDYRTFFELVANQVLTAIQNARAFEEERKRLDMLAEIDRAKTIFFSNVSHEFRTPLTLMLGPLEEVLAKVDLPANHPVKTNVETAYQNALRLQKLVNTLLDFSRIEAGRLRATFEAIDIGVLTTELASNFRSLVEGAGMQLHIHCDPLPLERVYVDREMWEKIVLNLLSNAFKFTLNGSITITVKAVDNDIQLQVIDTGVGIPADELPRLFERFYRVTTTQGRTYEGTGIGLSLVKELVLMHDGRITVDSQLGKGSTFTVKIPLRHQPQTGAQEPIRHPSASAQTPLSNYLVEASQLLQDQPQPTFLQSQPPGHGQLASTKDPARQQKPTVLIVDDNADMRNYIQRLLEPHYDALMATDGQSALSVIDLKRPDLVLSDIMMPVMDGEQLLKTLKGNPSTARIPVMLLSARAGEEAKIDGYLAGADDYLTKPFSANELLARVRAQLRLAQERNRVTNQLSSLFEQAPVVIAILGPGPDFVFELANPFYKELVGRQTDQLIGLPLLKALPELGGQGFDTLLKQVVETGIPYIANEAVVHLVRQGTPTTLYLNFVYQPRREADGTISGVLVIATDITEQVISRRQAEESEHNYRQLADELDIRVQERTLALSRSNTALQQSNYDLMQFASVASHDLKEPLRKIQAFSSILQGQIKNKLTADEQSYFDRITNAASRMYALIDNVLTLSKLSQSDVLYEPTDLMELVRRIVDDLEIMITEKNARIHLNPLPTIDAIPGQMHQLFQNLISNALKFNQSPQPTVIISASPPMAQEVADRGVTADEFIKLTVEDNGIGFDPVYSEKIFGLFQ